MALAISLVSVICFFCYLFDKYREVAGLVVSWWSSAPWMVRVVLMVGQMIWQICSSLGPSTSDHSVSWVWGLVRLAVAKLMLSISSISCLGLVCLLVSWVPIAVWGLVGLVVRVFWMRVLSSLRFSGFVSAGSWICWSGVILVMVWWWVSQLVQLRVMFSMKPAW